MAKIVFEWKKSLLETGTEKTGGRKGLFFFASAAERFMQPYVPADQIALSENVRIGTEGSRGQIHYTSPYAHYQWEGILYVDPKTKKGAFTNGEGLFWSRPRVAKIPSEKKLEYSKFRHPLATSHWDTAMMTARREDLVKEFDDFLKGLGR